MVGATPAGLRAIQSAGRYEPAARYPADIGREPPIYQRAKYHRLVQGAVLTGQTVR